MSSAQSFFARVRFVGFVLAGAGAVIAAGDIYRAANESRATARVTGIQESCRLTSIDAKGQRRSEEIACAAADRAKVARAGENVRIGRFVTQVSLEFATATGESIRLDLPPRTLKLEKPRVGDVVTIAYDAASPRRVRLPSRMESLNTAKWLVIAGIAILWLARVLSRTAGRSGKSLDDLVTVAKRGLGRAAAQGQRGGGENPPGERARQGPRSGGQETHSPDRRRPELPKGRPLPRNTPRVVSPRRRGLLGLFR